MNNHLSFFITREQFEAYVKNHMDLEYEAIDDEFMIVDQDDQYVMGYLRRHRGHAIYNLMIGEKIDTSKHSLERFNDLWIDRQGNAYYVPFEGHWFTATLVFNAVKGADELERKGWVHISGGSYFNWLTPMKFTDRQYDTVSAYCAAHHRDIFIRFVENV